MAKLKTTLWVGFLRRIGPKGFVDLWSQRYTGRSEDEVRGKIKADYCDQDGLSFVVLRQTHGRPNGPTTIDVWGIELDD